VGESGLWSCARRGISRDLPDGNWCAYTSRVTPHHCCALDSQREGRRDRSQWHLESLAVVCHLCTGSLLLHPHPGTCRLQPVLLCSLLCLLDATTFLYSAFSAACLLSANWYLPFPSFAMLIAYACWGVDTL
jgi:hypothetical protein